MSFLFMVSANPFALQELDRDRAVEPGLLGIVHHTHPATTELLEEAIVRNGLTDCGGMA
jgi:hypothetical protein